MLPVIMEVVKSYAKYWFPFPDQSAFSLKLKTTYRVIFLPSVICIVFYLRNRISDEYTAMTQIKADLMIIPMAEWENKDW
jgi:hypothetical protein